MSGFRCGGNGSALPSGQSLSAPLPCQTQHLPLPQAGSPQGCRMAAYAQLSKQEFQDLPCWESSLTSLFSNIPQPIYLKIAGSTFRINLASNHPSPLPLLPPYCQPLAHHLDYWSQFLSGLPASAPVLQAAAWVILYKWQSDHVTTQNPPMASDLTKWEPTTYKGVIWLPSNLSELSAWHPPSPFPLSLHSGHMASCFY